MWPPTVTYRSCCARPVTGGARLADVDPMEGLPHPRVGHRGWVVQPIPAGQRRGTNLPPARGPAGPAGAQLQRLVELTALARAPAVLQPRSIGDRVEEFEHLCPVRG